MLLEPRSLLVLRGPAREKWTHCIPRARKYVSADGKQWERSRRVSVTLRKVLAAMPRLRPCGTLMGVSGWFVSPEVIH